MKANLPKDCKEVGMEVKDASIEYSFLAELLKTYRHQSDLCPAQAYLQYV